MWLEGVFGGVYDATYFQTIEKIGHAHVRVGLAQRYVIAAMAVVRRSLGALIVAHAVDGAGATTSSSRRRNEQTRH